MIAGMDSLAKLYRKKRGDNIEDDSKTHEARHVLDALSRIQSADIPNNGTAVQSEQMPMPLVTTNNGGKMAMETPMPMRALPMAIAPPDAAMNGADAMSANVPMQQPATSAADLRVLPPGLAPPSEAVTGQSDLETARARLSAAVAAPIKKQARWKDALAIAGVAANNIFNPQHQLAYEGWGAAKHNREVERANAAYAPLQQMADQELERAGKVASVTELQGRPIINAQNARTSAYKAQSEREDKVRSDLLTQLGRMKSYAPGKNKEFDQQLKSAGIYQDAFSPDRKTQPRFRDASGTLMTLSEDGQIIPLTHPDGTPDVDPREATVYDNGYPVDPKTAATNAATRGSKAADIDYNNSEADRKYRTDQLAAKGKINGITNEMSLLEKQVADANGAIDQLKQKVSTPQIDPDTGIAYDNTAQQQQLQTLINTRNQLQQKYEGLGAAAAEQQALLKAPAPARRVLPNTNGGATGQSGAKFTEQQIRAHASQTGRNPDEAVAEAGRRGLLRK